MPVELRAIEEDELRAYHEAEGIGFGHIDLSDAAIEYDRSVMEFDRTIAGFDGEQIVATAGAFSFAMTVPGGATVDVPGVTAVSVLATHRRQGILRRMMAMQLDDVAARGEPLAILNASEAAIYGRFGYGVAQLFQSWEIDTRRSAFAAPVSEVLRLRVMSKDDALAHIKPIYDAWATTRPGALSHSDAWWSCVLGDYEAWRGGGKAFVVVCEPGTTATGPHAGGYAIYTVTQQGAPGAWTLNVRDLVATDPAVRGRLWRYLLDVDLIGTVVAPVVALDDPLRWWLADPRQVRTTNVSDFLHVRLLDIEASLSARHYAADDALVLDLRDPSRPQQAGRYRVAGGPDGAVCERVTDDHPADLELDVADLSALYLGGFRATDLAAAQRITERSPAALERADAFFLWPVAPFCVTRF
jgi:predicted acetyltransferase